jgi:hypothetical protein
VGIGSVRQPPPNPAPNRAGNAARPAAATAPEPVGPASPAAETGLAAPVLPQQGKPLVQAPHDSGSVAPLSALPHFELGNAIVERDPSVPGAAPDGFASFRKALSSTDVFYFDMDNTLVDTRPRHLEVMRQLLEHGTNLSAADERALQNATVEQARYSPGETAKALGLSANASEQYIALWNQVFWDPKVAQNVDHKMKHVLALAQEAHDAGKRVIVLSGRVREHWGDSVCDHVKGLGLDFLRPQDVLLRAQGENVYDFKTGTVMAAAATGQRVALVTDAPKEIAHTQDAAQKAGGEIGARVQCLQVEFPSRDGDALVSPDTPLIPFGHMPHVELEPTDVRITIAPNGKSTEVAVIRGRKGASNPIAANIGRGLQHVLSNTLVLESPRQLPMASNSLAANRHARIAIGGFYRPPDGGDGRHHHRVRELLDAVVQQVGKQNVAFMTSATTAGGTLDRLVTEVAMEQQVPTVYFTSTAFVGLANPAEMPQALRSHYQASTKVLLPSTELYGWAEMATSTALIHTGGQNASVSDFVKAVKLGNPVSLVVDRDLGPLTFDPAEQHPNNAPAYLRAMLAARDRIVREGARLGHTRAEIDAAVRDPGRYPFPFMPGRELDGEFLVQYGDELSRRVQSVEIGAGTDVNAAAAAIARHLRSQLKLEP